MFHTYIYLPLFNAMVYLYQNFSFQDLGVTIILLTIIIRVILFPLFYKSAKSQMVMQKLQPLIQKIQHDHKDNKEKQAQELLELYRKHKVNPFMSIIMLIVQIPILIALYRLFASSFANLPYAELYSFITQPDQIHTGFLGLIDLKNRSMLMVGLAAVAQYFQGVLTLPKTEKGKDLSAPERMAKQMVFFGPFFTVLVLWQLPSALGLYWLTTSFFSIIQQIYINKKVKIGE